MSIARTSQSLDGKFQQPEHVPGASATKHGKAIKIQNVVKRVRDRITAVWPLQDYVAVNPYSGFSEQDFLTARRHLRSVSDIEMLMPLTYYQDQFASGALRVADLELAIDELAEDGKVDRRRITTSDLVSLLLQDYRPSKSDLSGKRDAYRLETYVETLDRYKSTNWADHITEEVSKHCAAYFDRGQALWSSSRKDQSLYDAWRATAAIDRTFEILGVQGFRQFVAELPEHPLAAVVVLLSELNIPNEIWEDYLLCEALALPGWSAWTKYQFEQAERRETENLDFVSLLAMRLAYQVALAKHLAFAIGASVFEDLLDANQRQRRFASEEQARYVLLRASEIGFRNRLIASLQESSKRQSAVQDDSPTRKLAQLVFCIDVRSERYRRHLEAASAKVETFGFAGFFGMPIEIVPLGEESGRGQVPALISPHFRVCEELEQPEDQTQAVRRKGMFASLTAAWKEFQTLGLNGFGFVESTGYAYGLKLLNGLLGRRRLQIDGIFSNAQRDQLGPTLRGLGEQGVSTSVQVDLAESMLRGIGLVDGFAKLVVLAGHGSATTNNPLKASLDCGACGGHSGESNARFASKLLNLPFVRQALAERGIEIPDDTYFLAGLHNTTTDQFAFFDLRQLPPSHQSDLDELRECTNTATQGTNAERVGDLPGAKPNNLTRRSQDWSEVRPEWGLAGNAAFIAAPRAVTSEDSLGGRSFLHSYDYRQDPDGAVLEQIMTAPMVVAHWINMQYYASTVDPQRLGSGNKAVHNVVGKFGLLSGNSGDLMTGLPWQSVHDGQQFIHQPMRLLTVLAAPRESIERVLAKHPSIDQLFANEWLHLVALEGDRFYRYDGQQWEALDEIASSALA